MLASQTNRHRVLQPGDSVAIVAPASAAKADCLQRGLEVLRTWGLEPRVPADLFGPPYVVAHEDSLRWRHLREALLDPSVRAVWTVRGGYGCTRLLPFVARMRRRSVPRPFVGFSDITALHHGLNHWWGWSTWHGPVVSQLGGPRLSAGAMEEVRQVMFGERSDLDYRALVPLNEAGAAVGEIRGNLTGGNLKVSQALLGTPWRPRWNDGIVVLEDVNERAYSVDRMLVQLEQAGTLRGVRALVFGHFTGADEPGGRDVLGEVLAQFARSVEFPVLSGLGIGHHEDARIIPLGMSAVLRTGAQPALRVEWKSHR